MFDFRLKVFHTVAKNLSFSKSAKELFISQPAISKHINEIEKKLEFRLFNREGNKIYLTQAGKLLYEKAKKIFNIYDEIEFELGDLKKEFKGKLRIGASGTIAQWVIPDVLSKFKNIFPNIEISLISGNCDYIENLLINGKIDLGIVEEGTKRKQLKYSTFAEDYLFPVVSNDSKLAKLESITLDELKKIPLVLREQGSGSLNFILDKLNSKNKTSLSDLNVLMHLGSTEGIKTFLYNSEAMSIISCCAIEKETSSGLLKTLPLKNLHFKRTFKFITSLESPVGLVNKFISFAKNNHNIKL